MAVSYTHLFANQYIKYIHLLKNLLKNYNLDEKYKIRLEYKTCMNAYRVAEYICSVCQDMSVKQITDIINNALSCLLYTSVFRPFNCKLYQFIKQFRIIYTACIK